MKEIVAVFFFQVMKLLCSSFKTSWELRSSFHGGQIVTLTHNACLQVSFNFV